MRFKVKNTLFSTYCTLLLLLYAPPSETRRFLQSSSFWEARCALIGQLSSALWLVECLKRETEMLRPSPYCYAVFRRDETKTIKPITNEAFVASSGDIITDYNDLYCLFTHRIAPRKHYHYCTTVQHYCTPLKTRVWIVRSRNVLAGCESEASDCPCDIGIASLYRNSLCEACKQGYSSRFRK